MFTREYIKKLRTDLENDLNSLSKKYNLNFDVGNASYDDLQIIFKLKITQYGKRIETEQLIRENELRISLEKKPFDLNKIVTIGKQSAILIGYLTTRTSKPFIVKDTNTNKEYVISIESAEKHFA